MKITPLKNGRPGEYEKHHGTLAMYPLRNDIWRENAKYMQEYILKIVSIISEYEKIYLACPSDLESFLRRKCPSNVTIIPANYDDIWARDIAPTFAFCNSKLRCIDWKFNAWGGKKEGAYYPWTADDNFASCIAKYFGLQCYRANIVAEGGAIISDGKGTLFSTKSVLLNRNRNPFKSQEYVEKSLLEATKDSRIIWINQGLATDETNGHIDNIMSFVNPQEVLLAWTDDIKNPNYRRVRAAFNVLSKTKNINGNNYKIHLIPLPPTQYMNETEAAGLVQKPNSLRRNAGDILPASYLNYYCFNNAVLMPTFNCETDNCVKSMYKSIFKNREIIPVFSREPLLGGGGIHCVLHEIPHLG